MIEGLQLDLDAFAGQVGRVRCFAHIVQLVGEGLLQQFDLPKKAKNSPSTGEADGSMEDEDDFGDLDGDDDDDDDDDDDADDDEVEEVMEWVDEVAAMTDSERALFKKRLVPIRQMLTKVSTRWADEQALT